MHRQPANLILDREVGLPTFIMFTRKNIKYAVVTTLACIFGWWLVSVCGGAYFLMNFLGWAFTLCIVSPMSLFICIAFIVSIAEVEVDKVEEIKESSITFFTLVYEITIPVFIGFLIGGFLAYEIKDPPSDVNVCTALSDKE